MSIELNSDVSAFLDEKGGVVSRFCGEFISFRTYFSDLSICMSVLWEKGVSHTEAVIYRSVSTEHSQHESNAHAYIESPREWDLFVGSIGGVSTLSLSEGRWALRLYPDGFGWMLARDNFISEVGLQNLVIMSENSLYRLLENYAEGNAFSHIEDYHLV